MNRRPNSETLHQYEALDSSLKNIHTVLSVCELEQREVITQQVLDLVWTVQGIRESIIEEPVMDVTHKPTEDVSIPPQCRTVNESLASSDMSLSSPDAETDSSLASPEAETDTSLPLPDAETDTSLSSPDAETDTSLSSPDAETDTSLASPDTGTDTSLPSPEVATSTALPSTNNRNSSLCLSMDSDLEPSVISPPSTSKGDNAVISPPSTSKGDNATLVNTALLTPVSSHTASTPLANTTGILPFFKLAGQKIASLNQRSSPCKNTCTYHARRQKDSRFQLIHEYRTDYSADSNAKQIPMNKRVTLPPRQTTDEVNTQPSHPPPSILTCKPFLCASSFTPNKTPVTEISQQTPVKTDILKSKHPSSPHGSAANQPQMFLTWKASFFKTHTPKTKKVKSFPLTPGSGTDSRSKPSPVQKLIIKSNEKTVPQVKDVDKLGSRSIENLSKVRCTSSLQPWKSSSKSKSLLQPCMAPPLRPQSPPALCSCIWSSVVPHTRSRRDSEGIRERTTNANILMMDESEEGEDSFSSEFLDLRTAMPESHNVDTVTDTKERSTESVLPSMLNLPQSENMVSPTFESAKRKLFYNENKIVPLKKRFNPNFSESSKDDSPYKSSVCEGKPGTPNEKQITSKQNSRIHGKTFTPKSKPRTHGKTYTPKSKPRLNGKPNTPNTKPEVQGKRWVTPGRKYPNDRKSFIEETSRTSRARQPMQSVSMKEELVHQLEEILTVFMAGGKQATTKMLPPEKQNQLIEFASLCYISAVKTTGGIRLRKTSASRAPIPLDREWMMS